MTQSTNASLRNTLILQCLAALLIANSHLEGLYPWSWMAADGLLGNSLFFFLSGYGLVKSEQHNRRPPWSYYGRRVLRIYPALWLALILFQLILNGSWKSWGMMDYVTNFVYPTGYGYIRLIMIFYIPFFIIARLARPEIFLVLALLLTIPLMVRYVCTMPPEGITHLRLGVLDGWLWMIFYFQVMLVGGYYGFQADWYPLKSTFHATCLLTLAMILYVGIKFVMVTTAARLPGTDVPLGNCYFVLLFLTVVIVGLMFQVFTASNIRSWLDAKAPLSWFVGLVGGLTLEIYLIHEYIAYNPIMKRIPFPVNIPIWLAVTLAFSWIIGQAAMRVQRSIAKL